MTAVEQGSELTTLYIDGGDTDDFFDDLRSVFPDVKIKDIIGKDGKLSFEIVCHKYDLEDINDLMKNYDVW